MDPSQCYDGSQNDTSQGGFPLAGGNGPPFQAYPHPFMLGYQGGWQHFHPGMQQLPPNASVMHPSMVPQIFCPPESASPSVQNNDVDVEEQPPSEVPTGKGKKTKQGNFNPVEDVLLVKSYLEISNDPITSNGQKKKRDGGKGLWSDTTRRGENSLRSLQSRWEVIKNEVTRFAGFYADAFRENSSGMSDADKDPKYRSVVGAGFADDPINLGHGTGTPSAKAGTRPMGRDAAKAAKKKGNSSAGSSSEYASRMHDLSLQRISILQAESERKNDRFQQLASIDEKHYDDIRSHNNGMFECEKEKIRIIREKHDMEKQKEELELQKQEKQEEERILSINLDACPPTLRAYYESLHEDILEKVAARRSKRHGRLNHELSV